MYNPYKDLFLLPDGIRYLNCSNMSPMLASVKAAGLAVLETRSAPWQLGSAEWFGNAEQLRSLAGKIFQTSHDNIALVSSASYGLAAAAKNCIPAPGKEIIVLDQEFPSNYYVWQNMAAQKKLQLVVVKQAARQTLTESILEKINTGTGMIAIPNCHWTTGTWVDLQQISDAAKAVGAYLVLDLSQSLGVLPIDIDKIQPDFAVSVGYKWLLGPYGLGYMYVSPKWQETGEPLEYSWLVKKGSDNFANLTNYVTAYREGARKFDMGEYPQINLMPMAIAGLRQINEWDISAVQAGIKKLTDSIIEYKKGNGLYDECAASVGHLTSIPLGDINTAVLKEKLLAAKVFISFRGSAVRVSPHLYNNADDINALLSCLEM